MAAGLQRTAPPARTDRKAGSSLRPLGSRGVIGGCAGNAGRLDSRARAGRTPGCPGYTAAGAGQAGALGCGAKAGGDRRTRHRQHRLQYGGQRAWHALDTQHGGGLHGHCVPSLLLAGESMAYYDGRRWIRSGAAYSALNLPRLSGAVPALANASSPGARHLSSGFSSLRLPPEVCRCSAQAR